MDDLPKQTFVIMGAVASKTATFHWTGYDTLVIIVVILLVALAALLATR